MDGGSQIINKGRNAIWVIIGIGVTIGAMGFASSIRTGEPFIVPAVKGVLTILLLYFLYEGRAWARWLSVVLNGLGSAAGLYLAFMIGGVYGIAMGILGVVLAGVSYSLVFSAPIKAFFESQTVKRDIRSSQSEIEQ